MIVYIIRRLMQAALVMVVMSALVFAGIYLIGDPVAMMISPDASELEREAVRKTLGLDLPMWRQYLVFVNDAIHGNFGKSFLAGQPAMGLIFERFPATLELAFASLLLSLAIGLPMGVYAGLRPNTPGSKAIMTGSILGFSLPNFWVGLMLIMVFAVLLPDLIPGWPRLPASGRGATVDVLGVKLSFLTARRAAAPAAAGDHALALQGRADRAPRPRHRARGAADGLREVRPRQGPERKPHRRRPRPEEHHDPDRHGERAGVRPDRRLRRGHRDDLLLARRRQAADRFDPAARPAGGRGLPGGHRLLLRRC